MSLDPNLKKVPLTANFVEKSDGTIFIDSLVADPSVTLSGTYTVSDITPDAEDAAIEKTSDILNVAMFDEGGRLSQSDQVLYDNSTQILHAPSITAYKTDTLNVSGNFNVSGNTDLRVL